MKNKIWLPMMALVLIAGISIGIAQISPGIDNMDRNIKYNETKTDAIIEWWNLNTSKDLVFNETYENLTNGKIKACVWGWHLSKTEGNCKEYRTMKQARTWLEERLNQTSEAALDRIERAKPENQPELIGEGTSTVNAVKP